MGGRTRLQGGRKFGENRKWIRGSRKESALGWPEEADPYIFGRDESHVAQLGMREFEGQVAGKRRFLWRYTGSLLASHWPRRC